jgi:hypothetical protein
MLRLWQAIRIALEASRSFTASVAFLVVPGTAVAWMRKLE